MSAMHRLSQMPALVAALVAAVGTAFGTAALAGDAAPPAKAKAAEQAHDEVPPSPKLRKEPVDPMQTLRDKLAARLNASQAPAAKNPNVVRISTATDAGRAAAATDQAAGRDAAAPRARAAAVRPPRTQMPPWSYEGEGGPDAWGGLKPEFAKCASGTRQSPIDIRDGIGVELDPVQFDYRPSGFRVVDNGHTVQVNVAAGNSIEAIGRRYELAQFHFHRPSEERIEGRQFDMVVHLVHKDPDGRLAIVAVLLERGDAHPLVQQVWNNLPLEQNVEVPARNAIDLNHLLPTNRGYYTFMGSLTTPPCSEGVLWMVMQQAVSVSPEQIAVFTHLYPMNARPVQQAAGRLIKQSN